VISRLRDAQIIDANESFTRLTGYPRDQVLGSTAVELGIFVDPADRERTLRALAEQPGGIMTTHVMGRLKSGDVRELQVAYASIELDGEPCLLGIGTDVTEQHRLQQALREKEAILRATLDATADGIAVFDASSIFYFNQRFAEMWRLPLSTLGELDDEGFRRQVLEQLEDPDAFLARVGELLRSTEEAVDTVVFKDGRVFERYAQPLLREGGVPAVVASFRDVTERKRAEEAMLRAREELEGRVERRLQSGVAYGFTFREFSVLHLVAEGKADKEIARDLGISPLTVHKYVGSILAKMGAGSRTEAGVRALREGLLS